MIEAFKLLGEISLKGGEAVQSQLENISGRAEKAGGGFKLFGLALKGAGLAIGAVVTGAVTLGGVIGKAGLEYNSMIENSTVAWTTLLGSQEKAKQQIKDIATFAMNTQFGTEQVDAMAKYFYNAGIQGKALMDQLSRIADVAGAFNITADNAQELARQMSQVDQAGVAYTEDLNILQDQGVPIYTALAKATGTNVAQVKKMASEGKITADVYNKAFDSIANGVKGSADRQAQTMTGLMSTFQDLFGQMSGTLTQGIFASMEGGIKRVNGALQAMMDGFKAGGFKGMLEAIMPKATADNIVTTITTIKNAVKVLFDFLNGDNIKAINLLTAMGLSPATVVWITTTFEKVKGAIQTAFGFITSVFQGAGASLQNSGFMNFLKVLWSSYVQPIFAMVWSTISSVLTQIQAFWQANGTQIMTAVNNFWNFIATIFKIFAPIVMFIIKMLWDSIAGIIKGAIAVIQGIIQVFTAIFTGNWNMLWQGIWNIVKGVVMIVWNWINLMFVGKILGGIKSLAVMGWDLIKGMWKGIFGTVKEFAGNIVKSIVDWVNKIISRWNTMKAFGESLWGTIKNTVVNLVTEAKNKAVSLFESLVSGAKSKFESLKSAVSTIFNAIKGFMQNPVQTAKTAIGKAVDWIMSKFHGMHFDIPHIKLPHFTATGKFSLNPPSMPHFGVTWGAQGGILDRATLIGAGEAGKEALLPLENKYFKPVATFIGDYLKDHMTAHATTTRNNAEAVLVINGKELARAIITDIDQELQRRATIRRRGV
jgi:tape measure domain-containing protein